MQIFIGLRCGLVVSGIVGGNGARARALPVEPVLHWGLPAAEKGRLLPRELRADSGPDEVEGTLAVREFPRQPARTPGSSPSDTGDGDRPPDDEEEPDSEYRFQFRSWPSASAKRCGR